MLELLMAVALWGTQTADTQGPVTEAPATQARTEAQTSGTTPWEMPKLDYSGEGQCDPFRQKSVDGFGDIRVGTPCPAKPAEAASKGRSIDKRN